MTVDTHPVDDLIGLSDLSIVGTDVGLNATCHACGKTARLNCRDKATAKRMLRRLQAHRCAERA